MSEREARQSWALQALLQASVVPGGLNPGTTLPSGQLRVRGWGCASSDVRLVVL